MRREFSAGGIVFKDGKVLLIKNSSMTDPNKSYWGFPKGHIENGQSSKETALREVEEETGAKAEILDKVGDSKYVFPYEGEKIFKVVVFYLMRYLSGEINPQQSEIQEVRWFDPDEALEILSFSTDKTHLKKAMEIMNG